MRRAALLTIALALAGSVAHAPRASAACAAITSKSISGTIEGEDGRYVYAALGFDLHNAAGVKIDMNGCKTGGGYSKMIGVNAGKLTGDGAESGSGLTKAWSLDNIPANATGAWIEVYPKTKSPFGKTDVSRYGRVMRRQVAIGASGVNFDLPLNCGITNNGVTGRTGEIEVRLHDKGVGVSADRVVAWSISDYKPGREIGWGMASIPAGSPYRIKNMAPNQKYFAWISKNGSTKKVLDVPVDECSTTPLLVELTATAGKFSGTDTPAVRRGTTYLIRNSNAAGAADVQFTKGKSTDRAVFGDWNADGRDTIGLRRGTTWMLFNENGASSPAQTFDFGKSSDTKLLVGDWDDDGRDDVGIRRGNTFLLKKVHASGPAEISFGWGLSTDKAIVGDWDGDGRDTVGLRRGTQFLLRNTNSGGSAHKKFTFGQSGDKAIAGDWNSDMVDTVGVRRGNLLLLRNWNSGGSADVSFSFADPGDTAWFFADFDKRSY